MVTHVVDELIIIKREKSPSQLVRGSLILLRWHQTSVWKQVDLPVAESRSVLAHHSTTIIARKL